MTKQIEPSSNKATEPGTVYLVGAGPGNPGLITVRGLDCLKMADVILHDRLVGKQLLKHARRNAEVINVGKVRGSQGKLQKHINSLLISKAVAGNSVVRLKGGDPFVFGRGGEEAIALTKASIPFQVIPGVSSALAVPTYTGIPLTHRGISSSFTVVTGNEATNKRDSAVDWNQLAKGTGTLVILMGWENFDAIAKTLLSSGMPVKTPVALVQSGTNPNQKTITGTLSNIWGKAQKSELGPPIVAILGEVVKFHECINWFDNLPLSGKRILVTRPLNQSKSLSDLLIQAGGQPVEVPTIEVRPLNDYHELDITLNQLATYDWVVFTSANAVRAVFDRLNILRLDARAFHENRIAAIGPGTRTSIHNHGISADFVPQTFASKAIIEGLVQRNISGCTVLIPRSNIGHNSLPDSLSAVGAKVKQITAYHTVIPDNATARLVKAFEKGVDIATFTSSSTVENLTMILDNNLKQIQQTMIACVGPSTATTAREAGIRVDITATEHTSHGIVEAITAHLKQMEMTGNEKLPTNSAS